MRAIEKFFPKYNEWRSEATLSYRRISSLLSPSYSIDGMDDNKFVHINYYTMAYALETLVALRPRRCFHIVETGCSSHGTKSTLLWDKFICEYGDEHSRVISIDLNERAVNKANAETSDKTTVIHGDSLVVLPTLTRPIDFLYLDSMDVNFIDPLPSATHHLFEFNAIKHLLHKDSIVLIDDTPLNRDWLDDGSRHPLYSYLPPSPAFIGGKGTFVSEELEEMGAEKLAHQYQVLWVIR
jgi:Methyltransferase domain